MKTALTVPLLLSPLPLYPLFLLPSFFLFLPPPPPPPSPQALVHVSSAFAHTNRLGFIDEINYPTTVHPDKILSLLE